MLNKSYGRLFLKRGDGVCRSLSRLKLILSSQDNFVLKRMENKIFRSSVFEIRSNFLESAEIVLLHLQSFVQRLAVRPCPMDRDTMDALSAHHQSLVEWEYYGISNIDRVGNNFLFECDYVVCLIVPGFYEYGFFYVFYIGLFSAAV